MKNRAIKTNDIITGINRIDDMSDEELADEYRKRVIAKEKYIERNRPIWKQEGIELREKRTKRKNQCS